MNFVFLCPTHRQELTNKPHRALCGWKNTSETGINLADLGQHLDALPHLGASFEIADIILNQRIVEPDKAACLYTKSALALALRLKMLGYCAEKDSILQLAIKRISQSSIDNKLKNQQIHMLVYSLIPEQTRH
ncbi:MAG: hypothetical protein HWE10_00755 [Gammaproteobacteria bacterium]|nr:hypothetical protein [Gammaproteobacteria bacterium]